MNDPAFLFYPGDYLRDTQCLSETVQVAYDRIMCEHMRNICISQSQLNFFTKKLSADEVEELKMVLTVVEGGFQIKWVAESIVKRKAYSESRRENRKKKEPKELNNISKTYDKHMENENENENESRIVIKNDDEIKITAQIDFEEFVSVFNQVCSGLPQVLKISKQRKANIKAMVTEHGTQKIGDAFKMVSQSEFLNGNNANGWKASFDWILKPANFNKIIEGNYNNRPNGTTQQSGAKTVSPAFLERLAKGLQPDKLP